MTEEYLEPITPEVVDNPPKNTNMILITVVVIIVLCCCICLCAFLLVPTVFGPAIGNVFSEIEYELMLTPIP